MPAAAARASSRTIPTARAACASPSRSRRSASTRPPCWAMTLVTKQTGPAGKAVKRVYVEEGCDIKRELYLVACWSTARPRRVTIIASTEGGMEIEEVAHDTPRRSSRGRDRPGRRLPGLPGPQDRLRPRPRGQAGRQAVVSMMGGLYKAFIELDCSLVEINPLVVTGDGRGDRARRQDELRRQRASSATRTSRSCATSTRRIRPRSRPPSTSSTTSSSTATSAAWSTAPASPWRPWTSSSSTAARPPTSSMSAAAPPRSG